MATEQEWLERIKRGEYRVANHPARRRNLNRRGDYCRWVPEINTWVWRPSETWYQMQTYLKLRPVRNMEAYTAY